MNSENKINRIWYLAISLLCIFNASCTESPDKTFQRLNNTGNDYFKEHNYQKALEAWEQIIPIKPDTPELYQKIGDCYSLLASYHNALQAYGEVLRLQPEKWETRLDIAKIQLILMDVYSAEESWDAIKTHLNTPEALIFHGDLLSLKKSQTEAEQEYRKVLLAQPANQNALIRLALCLLGQNKTSEGQKIYKNLIQLNPQSPEILLQMSNFLFLQGDQQQAELLLRKAIETAPDDLYLRIKLTNFLIESGKYNQAASVLQDLLRTSPKNRYAKKMLIEVFLLNNNNVEAKKILDTLSEPEGKEIDFTLLKGKYFLKTLAYHAALSQFQMVLEKEPDFPLVYYLQAIAYLAGGQCNLGEKSLIKCLTLNPNFTEAELTLADIYYKNSNYELAMEYAERIKIKEPGNFRAQLIIGNIYLAQNKYEKALRSYMAAQQLHQNNASPIYYIAASSFMLGDTEKSLKMYQKLMGGEHQLADAALQYSRILSTSGKSKDAIHFLQDFIKKDPSNPYLHHILGEIYLAAGNKKEATDSFHQALSNKPDLKSTYLQLFSLNSPEAGTQEELLKTAISKIDNFEEAQIILANLYCQKGKTDQAIALLEEAVSSYPKSPLLANNLAWLYLEYQQEDIDEAMRLAQTAYELLPDNPAVADTLGWIYFIKKMPTRASWLLEQAHDRVPNNPITNYHLGMALAAGGVNAKARQYLTRSLDLGLDSQLGQEAVKTLTTLKLRK
ncbi:MAG: tetratricopeptide repeat protein [Pseudomonadota bacterium]